MFRFLLFEILEAENQWVMQNHSVRPLPNSVDIPSNRSLFSPTLGAFTQDEIPGNFGPSIHRTEEITVDKLFPGEFLPQLGVG